MQSQAKQQTVKAFQFQPTQHWLKELQATGVVVVKNVLTQPEVGKATDLFWEWLQALGTGIKRDQPDSWNQDAWPGMKSLGFFATYGGCHSQASWYIRAHPKVVSVFSKIWGTQKLITSFDTFIGWKPWWVDKKWRPVVQNLHVDQNPHFKKGLKCVQGMIPLRRVRRDEVGGLQVVPNTNNDQTQTQLCQRYPFVKFNGSDWVQLGDGDKFIKQNRGVLVECDAGDMILWDSRTIHGGKVLQPAENFKQDNGHNLVRLSMTVTMVPREWASEQVLKKRVQAFEDKVGLTHWPHEFNKSGMGQFLGGLRTADMKYDWPKLEGAVKQLV